MILGNVVFTGRRIRNIPRKRLRSLRGKTTGKRERKRERERERERSRKRNESEQKQVAETENRP
jgi:hypothetical protein